MGKINSYESIVPVGDNFRELGIKEAYTWEDGLPVGPDIIFVSDFQSEENPDADPKLAIKLRRFDKAIVRETEGQPGFGRYIERDSRSVCIWATPEDAAVAIQLPAHRAAQRFIQEEGAEVYLHYRVDRYLVHRPTLEQIIFTALK
jgi:hypothetical protein